MKRAYMMIMVAILVGMMAVPVQAKGLSGKVVDPDENIYIVDDGRVQTGCIVYKGSMYYAHITASKGIPKGSLTVNAYRIIDGKVYFFNRKGAAIVKSTRYIKLNRDGSVKIIAIPGAGGKKRYNCIVKRYQVKIGGKWHDVGMQCLPYGYVDKQL